MKITKCPVCLGSNLRITTKENLVWSLSDALNGKIKLVRDGLEHRDEDVEAYFVCFDCERVHDPHMGGGRVVCSDGTMYLYDFARGRWWKYSVLRKMVSDDGRITSMLDTL